jgi:hypothetical protein
MKRFAKMVGVSCVAALALAAMTTAGAWAATFTYSATGTLTGSQTSSHVFLGAICKKAHTNGTVVSLTFSSQHYTVSYAECTAFGFPAMVSDATYELYANGSVDIENTITISVPFAGCSIKAAAQKGLKSVSYTNKSGKLEVHDAVGGIVYTTIGGLCGSSGSNGTLTGSSLIERVGGGTISWDA